ncbi:hypothetical protein H7J88_26810 [Mycolicibacterium flavescens]|uniref:Uncharacterized protein n=1 Tax=Mycolicibacterium flavescens TaxID=1776 RepID=A0A1E3RR09_MYCFV|nr:hypothetical protein [Mycolicibacterium flavescens]MCV7283252.1 hypothetical protein [Mycolicibacterium flavescens]ODQ91827.1 hypothetical protein BHQ18_02915 [Mycolicibacterium flavescens]
MAGSIFFASDSWHGKSSTTFFVMDFLISQLPDGEIRSQLQDLVDNNIAILDLREPGQSALLDLIAEELPQHIESIGDARIRENLTTRLADLVSLARTQRQKTRQPVGGEQMDTRRMELNRSQSRELGQLYSRFLEAHPEVESEVDGAAMTEEQEAAWAAYSAELRARHKAERSALADRIQAERRRS